MTTQSTYVTKHLSESVCDKAAPANGADVGECWLPRLTQKPRKDGYCSVSVGGTMVFLHRLALSEAVGPPPSEIHQAAHACNTRACCRPSHLRWATQTENFADKIADGNARATRGVVRKSNTSGFLGVRKHRENWRARITMPPSSPSARGKCEERNIGTYTTREEAAIAYNLTAGVLNAQLDAEKSKQVRYHINEGLEDVASPPYPTKFLAAIAPRKESSAIGVVRQGNGKFVARVGKGLERRSVGSFDTLELALAARALALESPGGLPERRIHTVREGNLNGVVRRRGNSFVASITLPRRPGFRDPSGRINLGSYTSAADASAAYNEAAREANELMAEQNSNAPRFPLNPEL